MSGVAHEINNQLATAIGYSELLLRGDVAEPAREYLHLISGQTKRASRIVEDLLFLARRGTSVKSLLDVRDPLERALRIRSYGLRVNNIRVAKELSQDLKMVLADDRQLVLVFLNVVTNAEQAMSVAHHGGLLTVLAETKEGRTVITIRDDGPGISPEHLSRVFDHFFTTKAEAGGWWVGAEHQPTYRRGAWRKDMG